MATDAWEVYSSALGALTVATAVVILISTLDDFCIDAWYWLGEFHRAVIKRQSRPSVDVDHLRAREERHLAIMVPAWREYSVIAKMVENTLTTVEYRNYSIFVGTYQNDPETTAEVERMMRKYPGRVQRASVPHAGPTCKADCLNWVLHAAAAHEVAHVMQFTGVILHDCEDVIHPLELKYFNDALDTFDLIQMPVLSLELAWHALVAGAYMDDFSEVHQKDIAVRASLTGVVPGAGVALCYSRKAVAAMMAAHDSQPFNTGTLTEDYDFSFRLSALGLKASFSGVPMRPTADQIAHQAAGTWWRRPATATGLLATREYFPKTFRAAYRQRARWVLGIAFQGWLHLGWRGNWLTKYMFFRDRKGIVTPLFSIAAYVILANLLVLSALHAGGMAVPVFADLALVRHGLLPLLVINAVLLANRLLQRVYFVARLNGLQQGLMSVPRSVVNNFINFFAVCRAWKIFVIYLATGKAIAWDKTIHTFPVSAMATSSRSRIGDLLVQGGMITPEQRDDALARQQTTGMRLGQVLLADSLVSDQVLADAIAEQAAVPRVSLNALNFNPIGDSVSRELILRHQIVPFSTGEDWALNVAVASLPNAAATHEISTATGRKIAYFIACDGEIDASLALLARRMPVLADVPSVAEQIHFEAVP